MGSIRGRTEDYTGGPLVGTPIGLLRVGETIEPSGPQPDYRWPASAAIGLARADLNPGVRYSNTKGEFEIPGLAAGLYVVTPAIGWAAPQQRAVWVSPEGVSDAGSFIFRPQEIGIAGVFTVCEALEKRATLNGYLAVIVGVFKSGTDETLRLDCPFQLVAGETGWPSSIGLTKVAQPPENLRDEIEKKRQEILKSAPPEAPLRPERVFGLYGIFVAVAGLSDAKCCTAPIQTAFPPARLFGLDETDLRVIR